MQTTKPGKPAPWATTPWSPPRTLGLCIIWSATEPHRVGELCFPRAGRCSVIGRSGAAFCRVRPGRTEPTGPLESPAISREQLELTAHEGGLAVRRVGRCAVTVDGVPSEQATLHLGQTVQLGDEVLLLCVSRAKNLPAYPDVALHPFGEPDGFGLVGESDAMWSLRARLPRLAKRGDHVLLHGESGTGKELVANALGSLLSGDTPWVARNAATLPPGLADAELFGTVRNYPNAGMPERPGLVGAADGGVLFLDEIGELPSETQARLLRVLDGGEYHRLGDAGARQSHFVLIGATNRSPESLKHDLAARLTLRLQTPGLNERPEDVPLLLAHLLRTAAERDPDAARFLDADGSPRITPALARVLVGHGWTTHVRELRRMMWSCIDAAGDSWLHPPPETDDDAEALAGVGPEAIIAALRRNGGVQSKTWQELGLSSRHALGRLIRKYGIDLS